MCSAKARMKSAIRSAGARKLDRPCPYHFRTPRGGRIEPFEHTTTAPRHKSVSIPLPAQNVVCFLTMASRGEAVKSNRSPAHFALNNLRGYVRYGFWEGKITFQSFFISTTVQPLALASSRPLSKRPMLDWRS